MCLSVCVCESTERGVLWERALLFHVFQPFRPLDSLCLCSVSAAAASVADDDVVIWPCIKCSFVVTIVVVACHLLGFLVFGGPLEGLSVCVCVCGAQQEITTTREMEPIKILQIHTYNQLAYMFVCVCVLPVQIAQSLPFASFNSHTLPLARIHSAI